VALLQAGGEAMVDWYSLFNRRLIGPFIRRRVRATVVGRANLPQTGGFILAMGSHTTEVESPVVCAWLPERQLHFYAKIEYWRRGGLKGGLQRWFMNAIGDIPVDRGNIRAARDAVTAGAALLMRGEALAVYPEGTRSPDDKLHGAYLGTAYTLIEVARAKGSTKGTPLRIPIIPVGLIGMEDASSPKGGFWPLRCSVMIKIGKPIYLSPMQMMELRTGLMRKHVAQQLTDQMMREIARLSGKEYDPHPLPIPGAN